MAAPRTQLLAKSVCGTSSSPKTPSSTALAETVSLPLQITPLESIETDRDPETPHKDPTLKKKSGRLVSKRKLFLQNGQTLHINKAKRHPARKTTSIQQPEVLRPVEPSTKGHYPLTERQQLQYLLEVTAKEVKQDSGSSSSDDLPSISNKTKKYINKDNYIEARIRKRNERGETALHVAAIKGDLEDLVALIKAGAPVNAKDNAGWTPLHESCNYGNLSIVQELVWSGADVNSPGYESITPLHDAVINDHIKVVEFLLDNGADPKLQTSQNYSTWDLARSAAVQSLVSPEEKTKDYYTVGSQDSILQPPHCKEPMCNFNLQTAKLNGLNSSFNQGSLYNGAFDHPVPVHVDEQNQASQVISFEGSQDVELCINSQDYGVGAGNNNDIKYFHAQSFQGVYEFSQNGDNCSSGIGCLGSREREGIGAKLTSTEVKERNDEFNHDEKVWHFQQTQYHGIGSAEMGLDGTDTADVVSKMHVTESVSENHVQNLTKESTSDIACPNSSEESIATETLVQINTMSILARKPVNLETEEDTVIPEKLNECLDKAMIEISSYLETSQKLNVQAPCDERNLNRSGADLTREEQSFAGNRQSNEFVNMDDINKPISIPAETHVIDDRGQEVQQLANSTATKETEQKVNKNNVLTSEMTVNETGHFEHQPVMNFTKIKLRSERKKEGSGVERNSKSGRRKRSSTRSSESSKYEGNQSLVNEECTSHISNVTWRSDLPEYRYRLSAIPLCVPGYEDFLINDKNRNRSNTLTKEIDKDPTNDNQLDQLISQHDTEKLKLRMTLEQELVRLFGNCARTTAGYHVPYSACTVMTSQMRPLGMKRARVVKEQPVSIKREVDNILSKFNRLKAEMLKRQNREIEVVITLGHFWTQTEELTGESRLPPTRTWKNNDSQTFYGEDFELLPAKFNEYYEEVLCATD